MVNNCLIVGTTHLDSSTSIIQTIKEFKPDIIGIELDEFRFNLLLNNVKTEVKEDNSIISKIANAIKKKADENKVEYGSDMISADKYARENKIELIFVDKEITEIKRLMDLIPPNEVQGFMKELAEFENMNINTPVNENDVLNNLKTNYPVAFEFLITSRELFIANKILKTILNNPNKRILIFLGKGHTENIRKNLELDERRLD